MPAAAKRHQHVRIRRMLWCTRSSIKVLSLGEPDAFKVRLCLRGRTELERLCRPPVLVRPISAVARVARITFKELISNTFLKVRGNFGCKNAFSAADSGIATGSWSLGQGA